MTTKKRKKINLNLFFKIYFFITIIIGILIIVFFFNTSFYNNSKNSLLNKIYKTSTNNYSKILEIGYSSLIGNFYSLPEININIDVEGVIKLEKDREERLSIIQKFSSLVEHQNEWQWVPSNIIYNNKRYAAKIRLKGDRHVHFTKKKGTSYKVTLIKDNLILGLKTFSLIKPSRRNYIHEWIYHKLLKDGNLIFLKYEMVNLKINGENFGLYIIEENLDKHLLKKEEYKEKKYGPIFHMDEEFSHDFFNTKFKLINKKYWLSGKKENLLHAQTASKKLNNFIKGGEIIDNIFDVDKWAWLFASADINHYHHGLIPSNIGFYYNLKSKKFEPVGADGHRKLPNFSEHINDINLMKKFRSNSFKIATLCKKNISLCKKETEGELKYFIYRFFYDSNGNINNNFYEKYKEKILIISSKEYLDNFFKENKKDIKIFNAKVYGDYFLADRNEFYGPGIYYFDKNDIYINAVRLSKSINPKINKLTVSQNNDQIVVSNKSINNNSLEIKEIYCKNQQNTNELILLNNKIDLENKNYDLSDYISKEFVCNEALLIDKITLKKFLISIDLIH